MSGALCIALHDVAPATWPHCARWLDLLDALGAPPLTLLVVPNFHGRGRIDRDPAFCRAIERRLAGGDELALHGYDHRDAAPAPRGARAWWRRRVLTAGEGEFAALDEAQARERIARGLEMFAGLGWPVQGFVPPAWLTSAGARAALAASGLAYTTTHTALVALARPARIAAPCLTVSPRSAWRRAASRLWLRSAEPLTAHLPLLRLGLHPADVAHRELLTCWRALLERLLARRVALTKAQALTHFAPAHVMPASHAR